jgi:hypothetical protein
VTPTVWRSSAVWLLERATGPDGAAAKARLPPRHWRQRHAEWIDKERSRAGPSRQGRLEHLDDQRPGTGARSDRSDVRADRDIRESSDGTLTLRDCRCRHSTSGTAHSGCGAHQALSRTTPFRAPQPTSGSSSCDTGDTSMCTTPRRLGSRVCSRSRAHQLSTFGVA